MPRPFYDDTERNNLSPTCEESEQFCLNEIEMWDGPGICMRDKGHEVEEGAEAHKNPESQMHQEAFEGWVWNTHGVS